MSMFERAHCNPGLTWVPVGLVVSFPLSPRRESAPVKGVTVVRLLSRYCFAVASRPVVVVMVCCTIPVYTRTLVYGVSDV